MSNNKLNTLKPVYRLLLLLPSIGVIISCISLFPIIEYLVKGNSVNERFLAIGLFFAIPCFGFCISYIPIYFSLKRYNGSLTIKDSYELLKQKKLPAAWRKS